LSKQENGKQMNCKSKYQMTFWLAAITQNLAYI
jgi:hypothetical protein